jgi:hypothetical protein
MIIETTTLNILGVVIIEAVSKGFIVGRSQGGIKAFSVELYA